jgi:hypothetical protein
MFSGFSDQLSPETLNIIKELTVEMGSTIPVTSFASVPPPPRTQGGNRSSTSGRNGVQHNNRNGPKHLPLSNEDWEILRNFKTTKLEKSEGMDKTINDIRVCLNKVSPKNVDSQYEKLLELVKQVFEHNATEHTEKMLKTILDIVSNSKFYGKLYTDIYVKLMNEYSQFEEVLLKNYETLFTSYSQITYVDPGDNYDAFCKYNKENDNRKANAVFIVSLMKEGKFEREKLWKLLSHLVDLVTEYMEEENKTNEVEELTENIYSIVSNLDVSSESVDDSPHWKYCMEQITYFSQLKHTDKKSLSNRAIFKFMDIVD